MTEPKKAPYATTGEKNAAAKLLQLFARIEIESWFHQGRMKILNKPIEMPISMEQGTAALHHSSTKAPSGNQPEIRLFSISEAPFLYSFLAKQKKKKKRV